VSGNPKEVGTGWGSTISRRVKRFHKLKPHEKKWMPRMSSSGDWKIDGMSIPPSSELTALLYGFRYHTSPKAREFYFWEIADILWGDPMGTGESLLERQPWSEKMVREACLHKYLAIGGAASSGKSHIMAAWGIVQWMCAPSETLVLMTSTTMREARKRIWGSVIKLLSVVEGLPLKIRDSIGSANYMDTNGRVFDSMGLSLIAAERSRTREAIGKLIGIHTPRVILIGDELSELSPSILEAALSNLASNQYFQFVGLSNPASRFDSFGMWSEPEKGWDSVVVDRDTQWKTRYGGRFIRLDALDSPNVRLGHNRYVYLPTSDTIEEGLRNLGGENSRGFLRMFRAVFFDGDGSGGVYSENEITSAGGTGSVEFVGKPVRLASCDPSFSTGGDRCMVVIGSLGYDRRNQFCLQYDHFIPIFEDESLKTVPRNYQIARKLKEICVQHGVLPSNVAIDATGAGSVFCDVVNGEWSTEILRVNFGGTPTRRRVSFNNRTEAKDLYTTRVGELWFVGKEFLRCRQLFGIVPEMAVEMISRKYDYTKAGTLKMRLEPKVDYKTRMDKSPDLSDAAFLLIDLARERHSFMAYELDKDSQSNRVNLGLRPVPGVQDFDIVSRTAHSTLLPEPP